ncbi:hypothetical protein [Paludisphaera rhizosphaerae]|uniref:hypothetical protein n=1 Tax=Paludisphaera rhizosphaerae TaxID=2711216 RepID=UPI0013EB6574|nr:hypothetical protein [Paludisphaera rhizosphaerae]
MSPSTAPPLPSQPVSIFNPDELARFVDGSSPPRRRADRRRVHPPHPARVDPRQPAAEGPHWRPYGRVRAGAEVSRLEFAVFDSTPPAGVDAEWDPTSRRWVAIRLIETQPAA